MVIDQKNFLNTLAELTVPARIEEIVNICQRENINRIRNDINRIYKFLESNVDSIVAYGLAEEKKLDFDQRRPYKIYRPRDYPELPTSVEVIFKLDGSFPDILVKAQHSTRGSFKKYRKAVNLGGCPKEDRVIGVKRALLVVGEKEKNSADRYRKKVESLLRETETSRMLYELSDKYFDCQEYIGAYFYEKPSDSDREHHEFKEGSTMATMLSKPALCSVKDLFNSNQIEVPEEFKKTYSNAIKKSRGQGTVDPILKSLVRTLLEGVQMMHTQGFKHMDIKPANILLCKDADYLLRITDFGHTKLPSETGHKAATRQWASPQVFDYIANRGGRGRSRAARFTKMRERIYGANILDNGFVIQNPINDATVKDDIWALGVIIFQLYTGRYPKVDDYTNAVLEVNPLLRELLNPDEQSRTDSTKALELVDCSESIIATLK